jgi:uncharacterized membrane-anchored protein
VRGEVKQEALRQLAQDIRQIRAMAIISPPSARELHAAVERFSSRTASATKGRRAADQSLSTQDKPCDDTRETTRLRVADPSTCGMAIGKSTIRRGARNAEVTGRSASREFRNPDSRQHLKRELPAFGM